jgi:hypothetical protein
MLLSNLFNKIKGLCALLFAHFQNANQNTGGGIINVPPVLIILPN